MELGWNCPWRLSKQKNAAAAKLLEECGWAVTQGRADVTVTDGGPAGFVVKSKALGTKTLNSLPAVMEYINEDILQAQAGKPAPGSAVPDADTFEGCMVGLAVGDMVGLGVEGFPMPPCKKYTTALRPDLTKTMGPWELGARVQAKEKNKKAGKGEGNDEGFELRFPFGQISDDTQCSRE
eukprot:SAG22_NODE_1_length_62449_cov_158.689270_35_plen_180_part_00